MRDVDFDLLQWCRDERCPDDSLHLAHGRRGNVVKVAAAPAGFTPEVVVDEDAQPHVGSTVIECTFDQVALRSPKMFKHIYYDVVNDFGSVTERTVYRAIRALVDDRRIVCVADPAVSRETYRRNPHTTSGFYIRYDSPLLWTPHGLASVFNAISDYAKPTDYT